MGINKVPYKGTSTWYIDFYHEGQRLREKVGREDQGITRKDAEKAYMARMGEIVQGKFNLAKSSKSVSFDAMVKHYLEWSKTNKKSYSRDETSCRKLMESFSGMSLKDITSWHIDKYKSRRNKTSVTVATINRELACIKHIFTKAIEWGKAKENPAKKIKLFKENNKRVRFLKKDEMEAFLKACRESKSPYLYDIILLALNTGLRRGEIFGLKWNDIDLERRIIRITDTKNSEEKRVPIGDEAIRILGKIPREESPYLFPSKKGKKLDNIANAFGTARNKAGLKDFRFHDLRHTFASWLMMSGVDLFTVKELMGHKDIKMTQRYAHLAPEHKMAAVNKMSEIVKKAVENSKYGQASVKDENSNVVPIGANH